MSDTDASQVSPRLVHPYPRSAQWGTQSLLINSTIRIQFGHEISPGMRQWMVDLWRRYTLDRIPVEGSDVPIPGGSPWSWRSGDGEMPTMADGDSYALQVGANGVAAIGVSENGANSLSKIGSMTALRALCTTRSRTVGIPSGRFSVLPGLSIQTRLINWG
jgi:hypothetical protein